MVLKTLKELPVCHTCTSVVEKCVNVLFLKEEAIKWYNRSDDDKHEFIKKFFNITEEEILEAKK